MSTEDHYNDILTKLANQEVEEVGGTIDGFLNDDKSLEDTQNFYNKWAETYEEDIKKIAYSNPHVVAEEAFRILNPNKDPSYSDEAKLLDVACGTGLVSIELQKGYIRNIDALDACKSMLAFAKSRNLYKKYFSELVTDSKLKSIEDKTYDMILTTGSFCPGHFNASMLFTIARLVKPGGYFILSMRTKWMEHPYLIGLEEKMKALCDEGVWKLIRRSQFANYFEDDEGTLFTYQIL